MTKAPKPKKKTRAELERKIMELEAGMASTYHFADAYLAQIKDGSYMGSGVVLRITALGGREVMPPVLIRDGLSPETIAAIRKDIVRSHELATMFKPAGAQP